MHSYSDIKLGVNIDHIATLREARKTTEPRLLEAAFLAERAGCHSITVHPREDQRHVQKQDVILLKENLHLPLNVELANTNEMIDFILSVKPRSVCLVPEKREEITTEGGLLVSKNIDALSYTIEKLQAQDIMVSLFIDPISQEINAASDCGANAIELHTGQYANVFFISSSSRTQQEWLRLQQGIELGNKLDLLVNLGHGITYHNVKPLLALEGVHEFNIGHSIISRATMVGLEKAVKDMLALLGHF